MLYHNHGDWIGRILVLWLGRCVGPVAACLDIDTTRFNVGSLCRSCFSTGFLTATFRHLSSDMFSDGVGIFGIIFSKSFRISFSVFSLDIS